MTKLVGIGSILPNNMIVKKINFSTVEVVKNNTVVVLTHEEVEKLVKVKE